MIYADNAATTKLSDIVFEKMLPFLREQYGNASSQYSLGVRARRAVEQARRQVSEAIGCEPAEIVFNSGGSEGDSQVICGAAIRYSGKPIHVVTSCIEHHAVLTACHSLEESGVAVTYLPVDREVRLSVADVESALRPNTKLVSVMLANNEIGTIQPIAEIGKLLRRRGILFHTDAVQAVGHIPVNVKDLQVDFLTASAHKFNGAKGTGFMYIRSGLDLPRLIFGGEQENGKRSGTENVAGIVALGAALEESVAMMDNEREKKNALVQTTVTGLKATIPGIKFNGENAERLPGILNITFPGVSGESMMHMLDLKGICVSTSSACTSGKDEPSHVLLALGLSEQQAKSSIRISYGRYNTIGDAEEIISAICGAYGKITASKAAQ
jgi:cysteine desulfurase